MAQVGLKIIPLLFLAMRRITYLLCDDCESVAGVFPASFKEGSCLRGGAYIAFLFPIPVRQEELQ
jgi:hypothetical protein